MTMSLPSLYVERINTPTGRMMIVTDGEQRLRALDWEDHVPRMQRLLRRHYGEIHLREEARPTAVVHALQAYFDGDLLALNNLPTATNGTNFQCAVWKALRHIPPGETISYGILAARIGQPTAMRSVGLANGANPIAIVVPCHRVIGANGALTGYGGGLERKRWLLAHERVCSSQPALLEPIQAICVRQCCLGHEAKMVVAFPRSRRFFLIRARIGRSG
jgi:methylated-DNA-[protein]-cysteine S-methyltransferase